MHVNGSTKAKTALFWVLFRVIAKIWKKVQFGEATLLTQRLKPTFFSDFRALCMCGTTVIPVIGTPVTNTFCKKNPTKMDKFGSY